MSLLNGAARALLTSGTVATLVTTNADGSPQAAVVWVGLDGGGDADDVEIVAGHLHLQQKVRNVRRDPRVLLTMIAPDRNAMGLQEHLIVHGDARITEGGAPELLQRLAHVYLGPDVTFPPMPNPPPGFVTRIRPRRVGGVGPWT